MLQSGEPPVRLTEHLVWYTVNEPEWAVVWHGDIAREDAEHARVHASN